VGADAVQDAQRAIQSRYDQFDRAYMNKDFKSVAEVFTSDCVLKLQSEGRTMSAPRVIKGMEALSTSLTISHAKTHINAIIATRSGFEVNATWTAHSDYIPTFRSQEDHPRRSRVKQTYHDTWKKTDKGWQIAYRTIEEDEDDKQPRAKK
ncbi:MAG TPA: nuclear transport factor 2 family protein, partial [Chthonomonadaceae bacterium]|nr:nuclear transport factor 2 family protein [Chthonomonadaceae bacterium]